MRCYYCRKEACAKIGTSQGNIISALLGKRISDKLGLKAWSKEERYVCRRHYIISKLKKEGKFEEEVM